MQDINHSNHSGYTNFDGSPDLATDAEMPGDQLNELISLQLPEIEPERWMYLASGLILALSGLLRRGPIGLLMSALGGGLLYQGITGINPVRLLASVNARTRAQRAAFDDMPQQEPLDFRS